MKCKRTHCPCHFLWVASGKLVGGWLISLWTERGRAMPWMDSNGIENTTWEIFWNDKNQIKNTVKLTVPVSILLVVSGKQRQQAIVLFVDWQRKGYAVDGEQFNWKSCGRNIGNDKEKEIKNTNKLSIPAFFLQVASGEQWQAVEGGGQLFPLWTAGERAAPWMDII